MTIGLACWKASSHSWRQYLLTTITDEHQLTFQHEDELILLGMPVPQRGCTVWGVVGSDPHRNWQAPKHRPICAVLQLLWYPEIPEGSRSQSRLLRYSGQEQEVEVA